MQTHMSLRKRLVRVRAADYRTVLQETITALQEATDSPRVRVRITLYRYRPSWSTKILVGFEEREEEEYNKRAELATLQGVDELTDELFAQAAYVQARVEPCDETEQLRSATAWVSTGGRLPRVIQVHALPERTVSPLWPRLRKLAGLKFGIGDGWEDDGTTYTRISIPLRFSTWL
jgi:hypothetical protein